MRRSCVTAIVMLTLLCTEHATAASRTELDALVNGAIERLHQEVPSGAELARKASGMLVFPRVYKAGFGFGGTLGEGALVVGGKTVQYYRTAGVSFGFQIGGQARTEVVLFMTPDALAEFRASEGWQAGVDGSIAVVEFGVGRSFDTDSVQDPIIGFVFGNKGLMYDLSLRGSRFVKIDKRDKAAQTARR